MARSSKHLCCRNTACPLHTVNGAGNISPHGSFRTKNGKCRRWCCEVCDTTFSTNTETPYHRLHGSRRAFDTVVNLSVEGLSKSAIARVTGLSWNTVARWLERAAKAARSFNDRKLKGFELIELQVDEICTFVGSERDATWIFNAFEVSSRLWSSSVIGSRERLEEALFCSEDSETLNTSFIERLNLSIRQACAYLSRRTLAHARASHPLADQVELARCWYNFIRPHRALRFGKVIRTPAMQAGLVSRKLSFRDVFMSGATLPSILVAQTLLFRPAARCEEFQLKA